MTHFSFVRPGLHPIQWTLQKGYNRFAQREVTMSNQERRRYSREFKLEAVRLSHEPGKTIAQVARELNIKAHELYRWCYEVKEHAGDSFPGHGHYRPKSELEILKREITLLREERDILKKSLIFFSKDDKRDSPSSKSIRKNLK